MKTQIFHGDLKDVLKKEFPENHFDAIATDPPYGLSKEPDIIEVMRDWIEKGYHEVKSKKGFMGKSWDSFVPQPNDWKEAYRVLKPGGFMLAACGTRTYDWMVASMRFAGFKIVDTVLWAYGSGFPKSLSIDKAPDKLSNQERKVTGKRKHPTLKDQNKLSEKKSAVYDSGKTWEREWDLTEPASEIAKKYEGWKTALKPAVELFVLAQKPISEKTIAKNILKWGTGALNIPGCRIPYKGNKDFNSAKFGRGTNIMGGNFVGAQHSSGKTNIEGNPDGRYPSNLILDESAASLLDQQVGILKSGKPSGKRNTEGGYHKKYGSIPVTGYGDRGGPSRFFYVAKASRSERNKGLDSFEEKPMFYSSGTKNVGSFRMEGTNKYSKNFWPTVKPIALMRYLVKLITPPGGTCLDPFCGSGSTLLGCELEGFDSVGIDKEIDAVEISKARIRAWKVAPKQPDLFNQ